MEQTKPSYVVRTAAPGDLSGVVHLHREQPGSVSDPPPGRPSERQRLTWDAMLATDNLTVYVAETGQEIVGNTGLLVVPNLAYDCRPTAFLEPMRVALAHRRRGVGRLLVHRLLDDARAAGCYKVQLLSHKRHAEDGAHLFYRSLSFEPEAEGFRLYLKR